MVGHLDILEKLFKSVIIPQKVLDELLELQNFGVDVGNFLNSPFLIVKKPNNQPLVQQFLVEIDEGEAQAIVLALELNADLILVDEMKGRAIAEQQGLTVTGLLGVLLSAKKLGYLTLIQPILERLKTDAGFYISDKLFLQIIKLANE
ncbi:MAG: DUF3368 domain-containing protein [Saprospiraceae bacterium]|nr:DUF3368 domain-containing protein [Saprospiraceae bacterium]